MNQNAPLFTTGYQMIIYMFPDGEKWPIISIPSEDDRKPHHLQVDVPEVTIKAFREAERRFNQMNDVMLALFDVANEARSD